MLTPQKSKEKLRPQQGRVGLKVRRLQTTHKARVHPTRTMPTRQAHGRPHMAMPHLHGQPLAVALKADFDRDLSRVCTQILLRRCALAMSRVPNEQRTIQCPAFHTCQQESAQLLVLPAVSVS